MKVTRICDWDLEDRLAIDRHPIVVMFLMTGEKGLQSPRGELHALADSYPDARFYEIDLLENPSLIQRLELRPRFFPLALPMTLVFVGGVEKARHVGSLLVGVVEQILGPPPDPDPEGEED
jgi:hypothetical protein